MNPYLIPIIMTASLCVCAGVGFLIGFFKGAIKGSVDIGVTALCAILALPITKLLSNVLFSEAVISFILGKIGGALPSELGSYVGDIQALLQGEETGRAISEIVKLIFSIPVAIVLPIVFIIVFAILCVVAHVVALIVESLACPKTKNIWLKLLGGALTGLSAVLIAVTVSLPFVGYANFTVDTIEYYKESTKPSEERAQDDVYTRSELINNKAYGVMDVIVSYAEPIKESFVSKCIYTCGGKGIFNILTTTKVSGIEINLQNELNGAIDIYDSAMAFVDDSPRYYGKEQTEAVDKLNFALGKSEFLPLLLSKTISFTAGEFYQGNSILGIEKPNFGEEVNPTFDRILAVLKETDSTAIRKDVTTVTNIANGAVEYEVIDKITQEQKDIWGIFEDPRVIELIFLELYENERTRNMIPYITGAVTNYTYKLYNDVNDTNLEPKEFNYSEYDEEHLKQEAVYIANAVKEIHSFVESADFSGEATAKELILSTDLGALGRGLEELRKGIFTQRLFDILLKSILESEAINELGIIDKTVIENATKPNSDLAKMLVSRQNILKLAIAIKDNHDKNETVNLLDTVIDTVLNENEDSVSSLLTEETLLSIGMKENEAGSVEKIVGSLIDGINDMKEDKMTDEQRQMEAEKTQEIISSVVDTVFDKDSPSMFDPENGLTADKFVGDILDSNLASNMLKNALTDENDNEVSDPYKIHDKISESDKDAISQALENYQGENVDQDTLNAIAGIFGVR